MQVDQQEYRKAFNKIMRRLPYNTWSYTHKTVYLHGKRLKLCGLGLSCSDKLRLRGNSVIYEATHSSSIKHVGSANSSSITSPLSRHPKHIHNHQTVFYMMTVSMTRTVYDFIKKYLLTKEQAMWSLNHVPLLDSKQWPDMSVIVSTRIQMVLTSLDSSIGRGKRQTAHRTSLASTAQRAALSCSKQGPPWWPLTSALAQRQC